MSLVINHNLMAANTARNLNAHYGKLSISTQRLSSGLRINSAADDAAGLAIRELQRTESAALQQGSRNASDAVSLIQTADGALGVIDEKLTRMKELAEQAATGTYDSTQRLMIESEYQAMASEITRIANATDFNGIHLLDGSLESSVHDGSSMTSTGKMKIHFGTGNDSAEDYYYIQIGACTAAALGLGSGKTADFAANRAAKLAYDFAAQWYEQRFGNSEKAKEVAQVAQTYTAQFFNAATTYTNHSPYNTYPSDWDALSATQQDALKKQWGNQAAQNLITSGEMARPGTVVPGTNNEFVNTKSADSSQLFYNQLLLTDHNLSSTDSHGVRYYDSLIDDLAKYSGQNFLQYTNEAGTTISTQEAAQNALVAITNAVVSKDKIRAHLGALQNRLENTITNLNVQAENLQASESRISDVDVASEMTEFVRQQILAQSAVAMLSQANSMPKMAMQLISG